MRLVHKYGGSSVATPEQIVAIAEYVAQLAKEGCQMVVVASAMGKTTNRLIELAKSMGPKKNKREMDALLSTGEIQTVSLLAMAIENQGVPAVSMTGFQSGFITNDVHSKAFIKDIDAERVEKELASGKVVVMAGFQGITESGDITTLGRGGSDTTAVAIAAKLKCDCEIYTDVESVCTVDPRIYPNAKKIHKITYDEMMEMAASGAGVLETRCVELAKKYGVRLYLGKTLEKDKTKGTYVMENTNFFESMPVTGMSIKHNTSIVSFRHLEQTADSSAKIFKIISDNNINLDMINQNMFDGKIAFSFSCSDEQAEELAQYLTTHKAEENIVLDIRSGLTKITLTGVGMATHTGVATSAFSLLSQNGIPYYQITTSEISITFTIDRENSDKTVNLLADYFNL